MTIDTAMLNRLHRNGALTLHMGYPALVLQFLSPPVAYALARSGGFERDIRLRLANTSRLTHAVLSGDRAAIHQIRRLHARIRCTLPQRAGRYSAGYQFTAGEPELLKWVFATLMITRVRAAAALYGPVTPDTATAYYQQLRPLAVQLGIHEHQLPATYQELEGYFNHCVATLNDPLIGHLVVTPDATCLIGYVEAIRVRGLPLAPAYRLMAAALLEPELRQALGLRWTPLHRLIWRGGRRWLRRRYP